MRSARRRSRVPPRPRASARPPRAARPCRRCPYTGRRRAWRATPPALPEVCRENGTAAPLRSRRSVPGTRPVRHAALPLPPHEDLSDNSSCPEAVRWSRLVRSSGLLRSIRLASIDLPGIVVCAVSLEPGARFGQHVGLVRVLELVRMDHAQHAASQERIEVTSLEVSATGYSKRSA